MKSSNTSSQKIQEFIKEHNSKQTVEGIIHNFKLGLKFSIEDLPRYIKVEKSEYVKLEDILALFSRENS